jgi:hypothetical protein
MLREVQTFKTIIDEYAPEELKKHCVTWQKSMIVIRGHYPYFLDWVNGKAPWDYVIGKLIEHVEEARFSEGVLWLW